MSLHEWEVRNQEVYKISFDFFFANYWFYSLILGASVMHHLVYLCIVVGARELPGDLLTYAYLYTSKCIYTFF